MSPRTGLTQSDWIEAGHDVLRESGAGALKLDALTKRLGMTTGAFYHHFRNFGDYLDAVADDYARTSPLAAFDEVADLPPLERLARLLAMAGEQEIPPLDRAMRVWAATNERARAAVQTLDGVFLERLSAIFEELGFDTTQARTRAHLWYAAGAAILYPPWPRDAVAPEEILRLLTAR